MVNSNLLLCLYTRVLEDTSFVNGISEKDVKQAIEHMHKVYQGSPDSLSKSFDSFTDFNEVAFRCAYLFKYAPFHTALAYKAMSHALTESSYELRALIDSLSGPFKLCSLGGGPGADVIGVLAAMHNQFGLFRSSVKLVDIMSEWELTFWSVLDELRNQNYGLLSESMSENWFDWSFMTADLQSKMSKELIKVLGTADMVTMVKFVSAAASKETSNMIEKIFRTMKPGAFVLFVDNAAGGFKELISSAAEKYKFKAVSTPLRHQPYTNECFKNIKYGYKSCCESKVAVQLLMKSFPINYSNEDNSITNWSCNQNVQASPVSYWRKAPHFRNFSNGPKPVGNLMNEHDTFPSPINYSNEGDVVRNFSCNESIPASPVSHWQRIHVPEFQNFRTGSKPFDDLINKYETFETSSNHHGNNFSPSSDFTPMLDKPLQIDSSLNLNESFESQPFRCSTPHALSNKNWSSFKTSHDSCYSDETFENKLLWGSPEYNSLPHFRASHRIGRCRTPERRILLSTPEIKSYWNSSNNFSQCSAQMTDDGNSIAPIPYRRNMQQPQLLRPFDSESRLCQPFCSSTPHALSGRNRSHDSGYSDKSFEGEWSSPEYNSSPNFRASHRIGRCRFGPSISENESFWNSSNNFSQCSAQMANDGNSTVPIPYGQNMQQLEQRPFDFELPLNQRRNINRQPFGILQHSETYETEKSRTRHLKNALLPLPPTHPCPRMYKAPRLRRFLEHQCKPYERKRSRTK